MSLVGDVKGIQEGTVVAFNVEGKPIAVANVDGKLFAFEDVCTHLGCPLSDGFIEGTQVTCPCHFSVFNVSDGTVASGPAETPIQTYAVEIVDGQTSISI